MIIGASLLALSALCADAPVTLDDLKKLAITCFVPAWLPDGFHLTDVGITSDDPDEPAGIHCSLPLYSLEYGDGKKATFAVESAREGIGDRNLLGTEDADEAEIQSPVGPVYIIYTPKGKEGRKKEIRSNWAKDGNMKAETAVNETAHPVLGRFHGFTATGITVVEFTRIIESLHPVKSPPSSPPPTSPAP